MLVQFPDVRFRSSLSTIQTLMKNIDGWFRTSSYGKMYINYTINEKILTLPRTMASYGAPTPGAGRGDDPDRLDAYLSDSLKLISQSDLDLKNFKHIVIIHSGDDEAAASGNPNAIWSFCACEGPYADENPKEASWKLTDKSGRITHVFWGISTFSENDLPSILIHEFSHSLGVTDLYIYGSDGYSVDSGVGFWSLMDTGPMLNPPSDLDGWSKYILGWINPVTIDSYQGEYTIYTLDSAKDPKALLIKIRSASPNEYYLVHARRKIGTDAGLPSEGVVVFKIDATREKSYRGQELAKISDANPATPRECSNYSGVGETTCQAVDAPYNENGKRYSFKFSSLSIRIVLNNDIFWDRTLRMGFGVQSVGDDAFKIKFTATPPPTSTSSDGTSNPELQCVIMTATYGTELEQEVKYMRNVRDKLLGSSRTGAQLVSLWNTFYYSWSPTVAGFVSRSEPTRGTFRILLLPLIGVLHFTAFAFYTILNITGSADLGSLVAFTVAALLSITLYLLFPVLLVTKALKRVLTTGRVGFIHQSDAARDEKDDVELKT